MAQLYDCMQFLQLNTKLFKVRFNDGKVVITFVAIVFLGKLSSDVFTAFIPSQSGIFVYFGYLHLAILGMNYLVLFLPSLVYS